MAFGKVTKADLVELGLDPDKFSNLIGTVVTKTELEALKNDLSTTLTQSITDQIKAGFSELEGRLKPQGDGGNNNNNNNNNNNGNNEVDEQTEYITDPVGFVNKKVNNLAGGAAVELKNITRNGAYRELSRSLKGFQNDALKAEIDAEWAKYPAKTMAQYNTDPEALLIQIHDMVIGRHHGDIQRDTNKREGKFNLVHSGAGSGGNSINNNNDNSNQPKELTDEEKKIAKSFGMTDDEWRAQEKEMTQEESKRKLVRA